MVQIGYFQHKLTHAIMVTNHPKLVYQFTFKPHMGGNYQQQWIHELMKPYGQFW